MSYYPLASAFHHNAEVFQEYIADDETAVVGDFMAALKIISRGLFCLLVAYWVVFIGYTVKNLVAGGPDAAVVWYRHISGGVAPWRWGVFVVQQAVILGVTLATRFLGWRPPSHTVNHS